MEKALGKEEEVPLITEEPKPKKEKKKKAAKSFDDPIVKED
jgi:hypothetical protein